MSVIFASILFLIVGLITVLYHNYFNFKKKIIKLEQENVKLKKDLRIIGSSAVGVGQRLNKFEDYMQRLSSRQDVAELKQGATASYSHAIKIVEIGGSIDDIIDGCGLTRAEAELITMLHKKPQQALNQQIASGFL